jgi:hypothetical protein
LLVVGRCYGSGSGCGCDGSGVSVSGCDGSGNRMVVVVSFVGCDGDRDNSGGCDGSLSNGDGSGNCGVGSSSA